MRTIAPGIVVYGNPAPPAENAVSPAAFWRRLTAAERESFAGTLASGTPQQKQKLAAFRDYLLFGGNVDLDDDYIASSLALMEQIGILGNGRGAAVRGPR